MGRRAEARADWEREQARVRALNAQLKEATLSSYPPEEREAAWVRMKALQMGISPAAYRQREKDWQDWERKRATKWWRRWL
jgi:hypothetical protein